jgi:hypothetical protein
MMHEPTKQVELVFVTSITKSHENAHVTRMINNKTYGYDMFYGHKTVKIN